LFFNLLIPKIYMMIKMFFVESVSLSSIIQ